MKKQLMNDDLRKKKGEIQHLSRNKKLTKLKLLTGYDELVNEVGYRAAGIYLLIKYTNISKTIIHRYFQNKLGLLSALLHTTDYGYKTDEEIKIILSENEKDHGERLCIETLQSYFLLMISKPILREVQLLQITDNTNSIKSILADTEKQRWKLLELSIRHFKGTRIDFNVKATVIISFINTIANSNHNNTEITFFGLDYTKVEDQQTVLNYIKKTFTQAYSNKKK